MFRQESGSIDIFTSNFSCGGVFVLSKEAALPANGEVEFSLASSPVTARLMALSNSTVATSVDGVTWSTAPAPFNSSSSRPVVCDGEQGVFVITAFSSTNKHQTKVSRDFGQSWEDLGFTDTSFAVSACAFDHGSSKWILSAFTASECKLFETNAPIASNSSFAGGNVTNQGQIVSISVCTTENSRMIAGEGTILSSTAVEGDLQLLPGATLSLLAGQTLVVTGSAFINGSSASVIVGTDAGIHVLPVMTASNIVGSFSEVLVATTDASCSSASLQIVDYAPSSVTLTVLVESSCSRGLSAGAVAGIVVGCVVLAVAILLLIHLVYLKMREVRTKRANNDIRNEMLERA